MGTRNGQSAVSRKVCVLLMALLATFPAFPFKSSTIVIVSAHRSFVTILATPIAGMKLLMSGKGKEGNSAAREKTIKTRSTEADVIQFSGCKDSQTSADAHIGGEATGAMSYALITSLEKNKNQNYTHLLKDSECTSCCC